MNAFKTLHRSILVLFAIVVVAIVTLVHFSISKIVAEQSRAQQQSLSPAISLIVEQLLKPLHISEALGRSTELLDLMSREQIDEAAILKSLKRLESEFGLSFFLASENARKQYNSDGSIINLIKGEVNWYFKYRDQPDNTVADIGKWEDTHFYIDIKIYDEQNRFLGFFGVGKSLQSFIEIFDEYKQQYSYDFLFVDGDGDIMLSSDPALIASYSEFTNLSELPWYANLPIAVQNEQALNNKLVTIDQNDFLIAEVKLNQFRWTVFLLSPLEQRQAEISQAFIFSIVTLLLVVFSLFLIIYNLLYYFRKDMKPDLIVRQTSRLPEKDNLNLTYKSLLEEHKSLSIMLISIDQLSDITDSHGRSTADEVLDSVDAYLANNLRVLDVLGRWSSTEFMVLLPHIGPHVAFDIGQNIRHGLATLTPVSEYPDMRITVSIGISYTASLRAMHEVTAHAEEALYQARRDGSNLVRMQLID